MVQESMSLKYEPASVPQVASMEERLESKIAAVREATEGVPQP